MISTNKGGVSRWISTNEIYPCTGNNNKISNRSATSLNTNRELDKLVFLQQQPRPHMIRPESRARMDKIMVLMWLSTHRHEYTYMTIFGLDGLLGFTVFWTGWVLSILHRLDSLSNIHRFSDLDQSQHSQLSLVEIRQDTVIWLVEIMMLQR